MPNGGHAGTFYVEGVSSDSTPAKVTVTIDLNGDGKSVVTDTLYFTVANLQVIYTDVSGLSHTNADSSDPLTVHRIPASKQPDGVATDWRDGVDDGSLLLVRAVGSPVLQTLADQGKLQFALGMVGNSIDPASTGTVFRDLPTSGDEGYYEPLSNTSFVNNANQTLSGLGLATTGQDLESSVSGANYQDKPKVLAANFYRPPDEFDLEQGKSNTSNNRQLHLAVNVTGSVQYAGAKPAAITLTRPPLVLIHGINSNPATWTGPSELSGKGQSFVAQFQKSYGFLLGASVDHSQSDGGDGPLLEDWTYITDSLDLALQGYRDGSRTQQLGEIPATASTGSGMLIAVQKADIVAHSYGGLLTRWYLEQAATPGHGPGSAFAGRRDVRKLIELGTPNLGSPLANMVDEIYYNPQLAAAYPSGALELVQKNLRDTFDLLKPYLPTSPDGFNPYPFYEDAAVGSELLGKLNDHPFNSDVSYAAIIGTATVIDLSGKLPVPYFGSSLDAYFDLDPTQGVGINPPRSYFPYLEVIDGANDSIVPTWSAQLPDPSYDSFVDVDHTDLPQNSGVQAQVDQWLNDPNLPTGKIQRDSISGSYAAPISDQNAYDGSVFDFTTYTSFGAGINPDALVKVELNGSNNSAVTWDTNSGLGIHHPVLTGMAPLSQLRAGMNISLNDLLPTLPLDQGTLQLGNGITVDNRYLATAGPDDYVPYQVTALKMGRKLTTNPTGPAGSYDGDSPRKISYSISTPSGPLTSPYTELTLPAVTLSAPVVVADNPAGGIQLSLAGAFEVTDIGTPSSPTSYEVALYADNGFPNTLLYDTVTSAASEPSGVWNGLALPETTMVNLNHDVAGNILGEAGATTASPMNVYQYINEKKVGHWQSDDTSIF